MARILILEDDEALGALLVRMLERAGHSIKHCRDGGSALTALKAEPFRLLISDLIIENNGVPVADGGVVLIGRAQAMRQSENRPMGILAISGAVANPLLPDILRVAESVGADRVLPKPIGREALLDTVDEMLADVDRAYPDQATTNWRPRGFE